MEKKKDPIGRVLRKCRDERGVSVPELEAILGIPKDRIYKWEKGSVPKYEDRNIIIKWMEAKDWKNFPRENMEQNSNDVIRLPHHGGQKLSSDGIKVTLQDYLDLQKQMIQQLNEDKEKLIKQAESRIADLKQHNDSLNNIIASGLVEIKTNLKEARQDISSIDTGQRALSQVALGSLERLEKADRGKLIEALGSAERGIELLKEQRDKTEDAGK